MQSRREKALAIVRQFLVDQGQDPERATLTANLRDLGIDSMHVIDLVFRLEEAFDITIPLEDFKLGTVAEALDYLERRLPDENVEATA